MRDAIEKHGKPSNISAGNRGRPAKDLRTFSRIPEKKHNLRDTYTNSTVYCENVAY